MAEAPIDWSELARLAKEGEVSGGTVGVKVVAPNSESFGHNAGRQFVAASTVKIPIMVEVFRQIDAGRHSLDQRHTLLATEKAPGGGVLAHLHDSLELTLNDVIYLMISISDNTATNILIELAGMERINETIRSLGMTDSRLGRPMRGRLALEGELENLATPNDYVTAVTAILEGRAATKSSCGQMVSMLEEQVNRRRIARHLPQRDGIRWGSKTGTVPTVTNDVGFITTNAGSMLIAVYCEKLPDQHTAERVIGDLARAAMRATGVIEPLEES